MLKSAISQISLQIKDPHFLNVIKNNVSNGKLIRGNMVLSISQELNSDLQNASLLGASVEYLQASYLILDDIMDQSDYRRGKLAWHKQVGLSAINDGIFLREIIHSTLRQHFYKHKQYQNIVDLFNNVHLCTMYGQHLDMQSDNPPPNFDISHKSHFNICQHKTSYYTFYLPIMLSLLNANIDVNTKYSNPRLSLPYLLPSRKNSDFFQTPLFPNSNTLSNHVHELCLDLGYYFQSQDDMLDILSKEVTGKDQYQDVYNNKTTWLKSELHRLTNKSIFERNEQIQLYSDLEIKKHFSIFEDQLKSSILDRTNELQNDVGTTLNKCVQETLATLKCRQK